MTLVVFLTVDNILAIHSRVIDEFGGDTGVRDRGLLESAVAMPQAAFAEQELHTGFAAKAAAYHYHHCANHPFVDGNKRVAVAAAEIFLLLNGHELVAHDDRIEDLTLGVATGKLSKDDVVAFFAGHVGKIESG